MIRAVNRASDILKVFAARRVPLSLTDIMSEVELPKTTAYRYLLSLEEEGWVSYDKVSERYFLTSLVLQLSNAFMDRYPRQRILKEVMTEISEACGETVNLYAVSGFNRVCIDQVLSQHNIIDTTNIGDTKPLFSGAAGKVILAYATDEFKEDFYRNVKFVRFTNSTLTDPLDLERELANILHLGYAVSFGERAEGVGSVAAPVINHDHSVRSSIAVSGPDFRIRESLDKIIQILIQKTAEINGLIHVKQVDLGK